MFLGNDGLGSVGTHLAVVMREQEVILFLYSSYREQTMIP